MCFKRYRDASTSQTIGIVAMVIGLLAWAGISRAQDGTAQSCQPGANPDIMIAACTRVIERKGTSPEELAAAYLIRGAARRDKKQLDAAIGDENEALKLQPNLLDARIIRGIIYAIKRDHSAALRDFDAVLHAEPHNRAALGHRAAIYMQTKEYAKAIHDFNEVVRLTPQVSDAYYQRAMAYRLAGQHEAAFRDYETAVRLAPENPLALTDLAISYLQGLGVGKDPQKGAELLGRAAKLGFEPAKQLLARVAAEKH
jgi:tetratricopeptide (TPR) repeat protein